MSGDKYRSSRIDVFTAVSVHVCVALASTLTNKAALNTLGEPVILLLCHSVIAFFLIRLGGFLKDHPPPRMSFTELRPSVSLLIMRMIAQGLKMVCLESVDASFYQVARGLLLPLTVVLSLVFLRTRPTGLALVACLLVMLGFGYGVRGEDMKRTSTPAIYLGVLSSLATAVETVAMKRQMAHHEVDIQELVYANVVLMTPLLATWIAFRGDDGGMSAIVHLHDGTLIKYGGLAILSGVLNYVLWIAASEQIRVTSPITHMISTAGRGVFQAVLAVVLFSHEILTGTRILSLLGILAGTILYATAKEVQRSDQQALEQSRQLDEVGTKSRERDLELAIEKLSPRT